MGDHPENYEKQGLGFKTTIKCPSCSHKWAVDLEIVMQPSEGVGLVDFQKVRTCHQHECEAPALPQSLFWPGTGEVFYCEVHFDKAKAILEALGVIVP